MNRNATAVILLATIVSLTGCQKGGAPTQPQSSPSPPQVAAPNTSQVPPVTGATTPNARTIVAQVTSAVDALLAQQATSKYPVLPKAVKLQTVTIKNDVATLDFNEKFNALANMGDTTEAEAQKALRTAVGTVKGVTKMNVTVNGKPFNSQMTDWSTPFDVHYQPDDEGDSSSQDSTETGSN